MLIKIDRKSIKLNPDPPLFAVNGYEHVSWSFKANGLDIPRTQLEKVLSLQDFNSSIISYSVKFEVNQFYSIECEGVSKSHIDAQNLYEHLSNYKKMKIYDFNMRVDRDVQIIESIFQQKWLYEYEKTLLTCNHCSHEMQYYDLLQDQISSFTDEDGEEIYSSDVCPKCYTHNCCVYEFENINIVTKELLLE